ncbi:MAG: hypothetical protein WAM60_10730, partial [Candidatus Promineifilaceae bacterium]
ILLMVFINLFPNRYLVLWSYLAINAEIIRLVMEKGQMVFSGLWQKFPHWRVAAWSRLSLTSSKTNHFVLQYLKRYQAYYGLEQEAKVTAVLHRVKLLAANNRDAANKLGYTNRFCIVPDTMGLRAGKVRDVARGEIFIHEEWVNDPWLLVGQLLRRTPWYFDPRYLSRPFYYRTQTNRLMTLFVLQNGAYTLPYVWYQIGQEIKVARYDLFYRVLAWFGLRIEHPVNEDGTYEFDQFIQWLGRQLGVGRISPRRRVLWTDQEVVVHLSSQENGEEVLSDFDIAAEFTYPLIYVQQVLREKIEFGLKEENSVNSGC